MPKLRTDLDFMPSPAAEQPGLLIRDPYGYSRSVLVIPPPMVAALQYLDGDSSDEDVRTFFDQTAGPGRGASLANRLVSALDDAGFLDNERFTAMRDARHREFAESPERLPSHTGPGGYPADAEALRSTLQGYFPDSPERGDEATAGIAAPHASPFAGWETYASAYSAIPESAAQKTFVILGTSHYGEPDRFGLTRKSFTTPYGSTQTAPELIDRLEKAANGAVAMEDYCQAVEHSIEFQVVFLQHLFGADVRVLPILCGPFGRSLRNGGRPEDDEGVARFLDALGEMQAREGERIFWIMGVDMAHVGQRYGDRQAVQSGDETTEGVRQKDFRRIESLLAGDADGFWEQVREDRDPLRWCGSAPLYAFQRAVNSPGRLRRYDQWNIDSTSVVSFAAMEFSLPRR